MGRQHQGMDRPGVRQVPEGSGEQGKMEKTGFKIICGAPTTLAVKGLMMIMMMNSSEQGPISFSSLNVENLIAKLNEPDFVSYIKSFDIFCALETFTGV